MSRPQSPSTLLFAAIAGMCATATAASADALLTFDVSENGANLEVTASGTVNLAALAYLFDGGGQGVGSISNESVRVGVDGPYSAYSGYSGPAAFGGPSGLNPVMASTGDLITLTTFNGRLYLPQSYTSGAPLYGTAVIAGRSYATANLTPGTYTWTYGSGNTAGSIVLNIPAPGTAAVLGLAGLVATRRRR